MVPLSEILTKVDCHRYGNPDWKNPNCPMMSSFDDTFYALVKALSDNPLFNFNKKNQDNDIVGCGYISIGDILVASKTALLVYDRWPFHPTWVESDEGIAITSLLANSQVRAFTMDCSKVNPWYVAYQISLQHKQFDDKCDSFGIISEDAFLSIEIELPTINKQRDFIVQMMIPQNLKETVSFLGQFSRVDGLKFLTHDFDAECDDDFFEYVTRCRTELGKVKGIIPDSLYNLVFGFVAGPSWKDCNGIIHEEHCGCDKWVDWCLDNPGGHPSFAFPEEFVAFKNSIRIYNGTLDEYFECLAGSGRFRNIVLQIDPHVERLDAYLDVSQFRAVVTTFLDSIDRYPSVAEHPNVSVSCRRLDRLSDGVKVDEIILSQLGSFPSQDISQALDHFRIGGGHLSDLRSMAKGNFLLYLETKWAKIHPLRWDLLAEPDPSCVEAIPAENATGFTLIIRILHKV